MNRGILAALVFALVCTKANVQGSESPEPTCREVCLPYRPAKPLLRSSWYVYNGPADEDCYCDLTTWSWRAM